jgi:predicted transposase YbfD/YdcC
MSRYRKPPSPPTDWIAALTEQGGTLKKNLDLKSPVNGRADSLSEINNKLGVVELRDDYGDFRRGVQQGHRGGKPYEADLYYLTSLTQDAILLSARTRQHWGIENQLHWVKDTVLREDEASIKQPKPASLMAILRNLAVSLFRAHGYSSIVAAIDLLGNDFDQLLPMLGFSSP